MERPARVGFVGLGGMGYNHATNVRDLGHAVVAGADVAPEARENFAAEFGAATYEEYEAMYDDDELDAVVIATPNSLHEGAATSALERGIDVLCEKPLAHSLDSAERIVAADEASDAFCMVGFSNRFTTGASVCRSYVEEGRFGDVTHIEAKFLRRRGIPAPGSWFTNARLSGGGALIDIGVHAIDFSLYLAGFPAVEEVSAVTRSAFGSREDYVDPDGWADGRGRVDDVFDVDDSATALLRCSNGLTVSLEVSWAANRPPSREFHVRGTEAGASLELGGDTLTMYGVGSSGGVDHYTDTTVSGNLQPTSHLAEDEAFLEGVIAGERPEINTVEEALEVQRVIDAIYRSSEQGTAVRL